MITQNKNRIVWIDSLKLFACLLVVFGHLYMSMEAGGWVQGDAFYYCFPIQTIYAFHVPLFFVCSGYLYQRKKVEYSFHLHLKNIKGKFINLGVPYFVFSMVTLILKNVFSDAVHNQAPSIIRTLFVEPIAPYWYLYTLFFIFCAIPRQGKKENLIRLFLICLLVKVLYIFIPCLHAFPDILTKVAGNAIWFSFGMLITEKCVWDKTVNKWMMIMCFFAGILFSLSFYRRNNDQILIQFIIAAFFVYAFVCLFALIIGERGEKVVVRLNKYFMPVYLMHTIAAAGTRTLLLKLGISSLIAHFVWGLLVSIFVPVLLYEIAEKKWWLLFWIEPSTAIKMKRNK